REAFRTQALLAADAAKHWRHVLREPFAVGIRPGIVEVAFEKSDHALKMQSGERLCRARTFSVGGGFALFRRIAVENQVLRAARKFLEGGREIKAVSCGGDFQGVLKKGRAGSRAQTAIKQRPRPIRDHL